MGECDIRITSTHVRQDDAIASICGRAYAMDLCPNSGAKKYVTLKCMNTENKHTCSPQEHFHYMTSTDRHMYEILLDNEPSRLFFDLERPWNEGDIDVEFFIGKLHQFVQNNPMFSRVAVLRSNRTNVKYSCHLIFPDMIFNRIKTDMKMFVHIFNNLYVNNSRVAFTDPKTGLPRTEIDTSVYSLNRNFRFMGQSKLADTISRRIPFTFSYLESTPTIIPCDTMIQGMWLPKIPNITTLSELNIPIPDYVDIYKGKVWSVYMKRHKRKPNNNTFLIKEVIYQPNKEPLIITKDRDILDALDVQALRNIDFTEAFLPVLASLTTSTELTDTELEEWTDFSKDIKKKRIVREAKNVSKDRTTCAYAIEFLRQKVGRKVLDQRTGVRRRILHDEEERCKFPTDKHGWTVVQSGDDLRLLLQGLENQDNKFIGTYNERRRIIRITGRMGVGKTKAILRYATDRLRRGKVQQVAYVAPRQLLVSNTANSIRNMYPSKAKRFSFKVKEFYHNSYDKIIERERKNQEATSKSSPTFTCACVNSVECIPNTLDILILDEIAMSVGNVFIEWSKRAYNHCYSQIDLERDMYSLLKLRDIMKKSRVAILIDAAMTPLLLKAYTCMWEWPLKVEDMLKENILPGPKTMKQWYLWFKNKKYYIKDGIPCYDPSNRKTCIQMNPLDVVVIPPCIENQSIFTKLVEFPDFPTLLDDLLYNLFEQDKKIVVYVSATFYGHKIASDIAAQHSQLNKDQPLPNVVYFSSTTPADLTKDEAVKIMVREARCAIVSSVLGAGTSIEKSHAYDLAYLFLDMNRGTPDIGTMVQLSARVRSITEQELHYAVRTNRYGRNAQKEDEYLELKRTLLQNVNPDLEAIHNYHSAQYKAHRTQAADRVYCKLSVRESLTVAYSQFDISSGAYVLPSHAFAPENPKPRNKEDNYSRRKNRHFIIQMAKNKNTRDLVSGRLPRHISNNYRTSRKRKTNDNEYSLWYVRNGDGNTSQNFVVPVPPHKMAKSDTVHKKDYSTDEDKYDSDLELCGNEVDM